MQQTNQPERATPRPRAVTAAPESPCEICGQPILEGERYTEDGPSVEHTECAADWWRRNFGAEGLA